MTIRFTPLAAGHVEAASALALTAYAREREHVPALGADDAPAVIRRAIAALVRDGQGVAAVDGERLMGYLAFHGPYPGFFGNGTGCFAPLHGSAVAGDGRERPMSRLFEHAAASLVEQGADTFAITTWRHDPEVGRALSLNGFGVRMCDAIRMVEPPLETSPTPGITYREVPWQDAGSLLPLLNGLVRHLRRSPTFVAADTFTPEAFAAQCAKRRSRFFVAEEAGSLLPLLNGLVRHLRQSPTFVAADTFTPEAFAARREERRSRFFVAERAGSPIGYLELTDDGENVLTTAPDMRNICGAFLAEEYRGSHVYRNILAHTLATLRAEGVRRIGVDFETMNPTALGFWLKHFDAYTWSYARRIDALG